MDPMRRGNYDSGQDYVLEYGELRFTFNERDFSERVEQAYDGRGLAAYQCVNKKFYDWPDLAPDAIRAFDLRDRCSE